MGPQPAHQGTTSAPVTTASVATTSAAPAPTDPPPGTSVLPDTSAPSSTGSPADAPPSGAPAAPLTNSAPGDTDTGAGDPPTTAAPAAPHGERPAIRTRRRGFPCARRRHDPRLHRRQHRRRLVHRDADRLGGCPRVSRCSASPLTGTTVCTTGEGCLLPALRPGATVPVIVEVRVGAGASGRRGADHRRTDRASGGDWWCCRRHQHHRPAHRRAAHLRAGPPQAGSRLASPATGHRRRCFGGRRRPDPAVASPGRGRREPRRPPIDRPPTCRFDGGCLTERFPTVPRASRGDRPSSAVDSPGECDRNRPTASARQVPGTGQVPGRRRHHLRRRRRSVQPAVAHRAGEQGRHRQGHFGPGRHHPQLRPQPGVVVQPPRRPRKAPRGDAVLPGQRHRAGPEPGSAGVVAVRLRVQHRRTTRRSRSPSRTSSRRTSSAPCWAWPSASGPTASGSSRRS